MQRSRPPHLLCPRPALRCLVTRRALCITSPAILRPTTLDVEPGGAPPELHRRLASPGPMCGAAPVGPGPPRNDDSPLERGVVVGGGRRRCTVDLVVLAGDPDTASHPFNALGVGGHLLLDLLREDANELERGLRVGDARPRLLSLEPDPGHDLMRPKTAAQHSLSEVVGPVLDA